jgi:hypothetical protein
LAQLLGLQAGKSFHFVLNDTVYFDNRIPPRGFTHADFVEIQSEPVGYTYPDGQYWDDTAYMLPTSAVEATVTLYYQTTSKEYVEFLRDANTTNSAGQDLYNAWVAQGMSAPEIMAQVTVPVSVTGSAVEDPVRDPILESPSGVRFHPSRPSPFSSSTYLGFTLPRAEHVHLAVYDLDGRRVRTLTDRPLDAGTHQLTWDGCNEEGAPLAPGVYFVRLEAGTVSRQQKVILMR